MDTQEKTKETMDNNIAQIEKRVEELDKQKQEWERKGRSLQKRTEQLKEEILREAKKEVQEDTVINTKGRLSKGIAEMKKIKDEIEKRLKTYKGYIDIGYERI